MKRKFTGITVASFILLVIAVPLVAAHDHPVYFPEDQYTEPDVLEDQPLEGVILFWVWSLHDKIHWIFVILMLYTCYSFRVFSERKIYGHPRTCFQPGDKGYSGESGLHRYHRYFWAANVILILIHWSEVLTGYGFGLDYTYTFTFQAPGIIFETFYVAAFTAWLFSCHFFRYFLGSDPYPSCSLGGKIRAGAFSRISRFNERHSVFMWIAILSMALLIVVEGHL